MSFTKVSFKTKFEMSIRIYKNNYFIIIIYFDRLRSKVDDFFNIKLFISMSMLILRLLII